MAGLSYMPAGPDVVEFVNEVMNEYHPELMRAGVTVNTLMAFGDLKLHGYDCAAVIKINSVQDRIEKKADCTLKIEYTAWETMDEARRRALIDHELHHLTVKVIDRTKYGEPVFKHDAAGRPVVKMRLHDLVVGGFKAIAERHGRNALEVSHVKACYETLRQLTLWGDDQAGATEAEQEAAVDEVTISGGGKSVTMTADRPRKRNGATAAPANESRA